MSERTYAHTADRPGWQAGHTRFVLVLLMMLVALFPLVVGEGADVVAYGDLVFACLVVLGNMFLRTFRDRVYGFLSPSAIAFNYTCISFALGALAFRQGWILVSPEGLEAYYHLDNRGKTTTLFSVSAVALLLALLGPARRPLRLMIRWNSGSVDRYWLFVGISFLLVFFFLDLPIAMSGRTGNFAFLPRVMGAVAITLYAGRRPMSQRMVLYLAIAAYFAVVHFEDKRMFVLYAFTLVLVEAARARDERLRLRSVVLAFMALVGAGVGVLAISVFRGYGQLGAETLFDAALLVPTYLSLERSVAMALRNFEFTATYFHSFNATDYAIRTPTELYYGASYLKPLLVAFPRELIPWKPVSVFARYTEVFYPTFREAGGSYIPNVFAEAFWNFHVVGPAAITLVFLVFNRMFSTMCVLLRSSYTPLVVLLVCGYLFAPVYYRAGELSLLAVYGGILGVVFAGIEGVHGIRPIGVSRKEGMSLESSADGQISRGDWR